MIIWKTGHHIADTVADALATGFNGTVYETKSLLHFDFSKQCSHIGYGILRGQSDVFKRSYQVNFGQGVWFNVDRGYFSPHHFDGYYRISHRGTQQTNLKGLEPDYERLAQLNLDIKPWRGFDKSKPVLVCPPTNAVAEFFYINPDLWLWYHTYPNNPEIQFVIRTKDDTSPIDFNDYNYVLTFNSSVGWQALQAGIPCVSDTRCSIVGSYYHNILLDDLDKSQHTTREQLFGIMASLQFTLSEIRAGKACKLVETLMST